MKSKSQLIMGAGILLILILAIAIGIFATLSEDEKKPVKHNKEEDSQTEQTTVFDETTSETILITAIDTEACTIKAVRITDGEEVDYTYNGATDVRTSYDKIISASLLKPGDILDIAYYNTGLLASAIGSKEVWSYKNIHNMIIDDSLKKITVSDHIYRYEDWLKIINSKGFTTLDSLSNIDYLNIYGIDNYIYLIRVSSGHGFLQLVNYEDFIGGTLCIGRDNSIIIENNMKLELPEGEYSVTATNLELMGNATIKITPGYTSTFDLSPFKPIPLPSGNVTFNISPEGADLFIDGVKTMYDNPISLTYGTHEIEVSLGGYTSYHGNLEIEKSDYTQNISLSPSPVETDDDLLYEEDTESSISDSSILDDIEDITDEPIDNSDVEIPDSTTDNSPESITDSISDEDIIDNNIPTEDEITETDNTEVSGTMTFSTTDGTKLYINDEYKGTINNGVLKLNKLKGTLYIMLEKEGYITRNYTIYVEDDGTDAEFSFPDMLAK